MTESNPWIYGNFMQRPGIRLKATFYQVVQWVDEGSAGAEHNEGDEVKVIKFIS